MYTPTTTTATVLLQYYYTRLRIASDTRQYRSYTSSLRYAVLFHGSTTGTLRRANRSVSPRRPSPRVSNE